MAKVTFVSVCVVLVWNPWPHARSPSELYTRLAMI